MEKSERKVLLVICVITLCLLGLFWWLGKLASQKEISTHRAEESARLPEADRTLSGRAVDAGTGAPAAGVRIRTWDGRRLRPRIGHNSLLQTTTGKDGTFTFEDTKGAAGASPAGFTFESGDDFLYIVGRPGPLERPGAPRETAGSAAGEDAGQPELVLKLRRGGMILGRVLDPAGAPCPAAVVLLEECGQKDPAQGSGASAPTGLMRKTDSDRNGSFLFRRLPAGIDVRVTALHPSFACAQSAPLRIEPGERTPLDLLLQPGAALSGKVLSAKGKPVAGALVYACGPPPDRKPLWDGKPFSTDEKVDAGLAVRSGPDGTFRMVCSLDGQGEGAGSKGFHLAACATEFVTGYSREIALAGGSPAPESADIVLPDSARIEGRVMGRDEIPIAGALIKASVEDGGDVHRAFARSDGSGAFVLGPLPSGRPAALRIEARGFPDAALTGVIPGGEPVTAILGAGGTLKGTVQSSATGKPVPGFRVFLQPAGGPARRIKTFQGRDGAFAVSGLSAGSWDLIVSAEGFETRTLKGIGVKEGQEAAGLTVNLKKVTEISGTVSLAGSGEPLAGVEVMPVLRYPDGLLRVRPEKAATTGPDGGFVITGLAPGTYFLDLYGKTPPILWRHGALRLAPGEVASGAAVTVGVGAGRLEVAVLGPGGKPCQGVRVEIAPASESKLPGTGGGGAFETDAGGKIAFPYLAPGLKTAIVSLANEGGPVLYRTKHQVLVKAGETASLGVSFAPIALCRVFGTITRGAAPAGAGRLKAVPMDGNRPDPDGAHATGIDTGGNYSFAALPSGRYLFTLEAGGLEPLSHNPVVVPADEKELRVDFDLAAGRIAGAVVDKASGRPVAKASVFLYAPAAAGERGSAIQTATAGTDGAFSFRGLEAGRYIISALGSVGVGHLEKIQLKAGAALVGQEVALEPAGGLNVLVQNEGKKLIEGAMVWAEKTGTGAITAPRRGLTLSSGQGPSRFFPLEPGEYRVVVGGPGRVSHVEPAVTVEPGKTSTITAVLAKGAQVELTVTDKAGAPVRNCRLAVFGPDGQWIGPPLSGTLIAQGEHGDAGGKYALGGYAPGAYRAHVFADGFTPRSVAFTIPEKAAPGPVTLTLVPAP